MTSTRDRIVEIARSVEKDSEPWHSIAVHSTAFDEGAWFSPDDQLWVGSDDQAWVGSDDQAWFWTVEWQAGESEATLEIQKGQLSETLKGEDEIRRYLSNL